MQHPSVSVEVGRCDDQTSDLDEDDILQLLSTKVEKTELEELIKLKTNK